MYVKYLTFTEHVIKRGYCDCILIEKAISRDSTNSKLHRLSDSWIINLATH